MYSKDSLGNIIKKTLQRNSTKWIQRDRLEGKREQGQVFRGDEVEHRAAREPQADQTKKLTPIHK